MSRYVLCMAGEAPQYAATREDAEKFARQFAESRQCSVRIYESGGVDRIGDLITKIYPKVGGEDVIHRDFYQNRVGG